MDVSQLMRIVSEEELDTPILYGVGGFRLDAVVLERDRATLKVYLVDERNQVFESTTRTFDNEPQALEYVILKLRQVKEARSSMGEIRAHRVQ